MKSGRSNRREFARAAMAGVVLSGSVRAEKRALEPLSPGAKVTLQLQTDFTEDDLNFAKQIGVEYITVGTSGGTYETFADIKKRIEGAGLKVTNIGNTNVHNMPEVTLNLPGRDRKIEEYKQYLRNLGRAGIYYTTYAHMGNGIWSSHQETTRGGAPTRAFHATTAKGYWMKTVFEPPLTQGRKFSKEEMWENYTYFIKQVVPVAEETGVRIGIHPDDPTVQVLAGVPRCIFGNFEGYKRAMEIANSPNVGICLCCGTWLEGGKQLTGKDPEEMIRYFGAAKIRKIHFRNFSAPLPHFVETFMDNGYYDMYKIMKALRDVNYDGIVILDHSPTMVGGNYAQTAYGFAYMKALMNRANAEAKG